MSYEIVGTITRLPYVKGTKAECFRELNKKFPYSIKDEDHRHGRVNIDRLYQEPLMVIEKED